MNLMIWLVAGGAIAWLSIAVLHINKNRGLIPTLIIGAVGALVGGQSFAPMMTSVTAPEIGFSPFALVVALATAIACLIVSNVLAKRYGI
jgi:uncharacterized membrane protein YeaQ/YmgE (transglycosylase-associated protein family)